MPSRSGGCSPQRRRIKPLPTSEYTNRVDWLLHNGSVITRRHFLSAGLAAPVAWPALAAAPGDSSGLRLEYTASSPPRVPPPLVLESPATAVVEIGGSGPSARCSIGVRVSLGGEPCLLPLAVWADEFPTYLRHREALHLPAYRGKIERDGGGWSLTVDGRRVYSARPGATPPAAGGGRGSPPWATYRHALHADWRRGPIDGAAELWVLPPAQGSSQGELRVGELTATGDLCGWLTRLGAAGPVSAAAAAVTALPDAGFAREVDAEALAPFALRNYPGGAAQVGVPDTTYLDPPSLAAYRGRPEQRLPGLMIVAVDAAVAREPVEQLLPPPCEAPETAVVRIMALRGLDDPSLDEAWLFANCLLEGRKVWYAASHIRGTTTGAEFGREALGYPTTAGSVTATLGASQFSASVERDGMGLCFATGFYGGFSTGTSLADMTVAALRLRPGAAGQERRGEIVTQPWRFQGLRKPVRRESLVATFHAAESGYAPAAWNRVGPANAYWAMVFDSAVMQRLPGAVVAEVENPGPYYRDRCRGRLPWQRPGTDEDQEASD